MATVHKKGISSHQLSRDIKVTQKTAWYMLHRIRLIIRTKSFNKPLGGIVEVDETYMGGKEKNKHASKKTKGAQGRSTATKAPVMGMIQRGGELRTQHVSNTRKETLQPIIGKNVSVRLTPSFDLVCDVLSLGQNFYSMSRESLSVKMKSLVEQYRVCGESRKAFAHAHGISEAKLSYWLKKLSKSTPNNKKEPSPCGFVALEVEPSPLKGRDHLLIRLVSGVEIEIPL